MLDFVKKYREVLDQLDETLGDDFPLWDVIEKFDREQEFTEEKAERRERLGLPPDDTAPPAQDAAAPAESTTPPAQPRSDVKRVDSAAAQEAPAEGSQGAEPQNPPAEPSERSIRQCGTVAVEPRASPQLVPKLGVRCRSTARHPPQLCPSRFSLPLVVRAASSPSANQLPRSIHSEES